MKIYGERDRERKRARKSGERGSKRASFFRFHLTSLLRCGGPLFTCETLGFNLRGGGKMVCVIAAGILLVMEVPCKIVVKFLRLVLN